MAASTTALKRTHCFRRMLASHSRSSPATSSSSTYYHRSRSSSRPNSPLTCNLDNSLEKKFSLSSIELSANNAYFLDRNKCSALSSPLSESRRINFSRPKSVSSSSLNYVNEQVFDYPNETLSNLPLNPRRNSLEISLG